MSKSFRCLNPRVSDQIEDIGVDGRDKVKMDLQKVRCGTLIESVWLRMGEVAVTCEYTDGHSGSVKSREFLDQLRTG